MVRCSILGNYWPSRGQILRKKKNPCKLSTFANMKIRYLVQNDTGMPFSYQKKNGPMGTATACINMTYLGLTQSPTNACKWKVSHKTHKPLETHSIMHTVAREHFWIPSSSIYIQVVGERCFHWDYNHTEKWMQQSQERYEWLVWHKNHITGTSNGTDAPWWCGWYLISPSACMYLYNSCCVYISPSRSWIYTPSVPSFPSPFIPCPGSFFLQGIPRTPTIEE